MTNDAVIEFPEQLFSRELTRIGTDIQQGMQPEKSLIELYELLVNYGHEIDCDTQSLGEQQSSEPAVGTPNNHRLSDLVAMLQDTQTRLRSRLLNLAERLEELDSAHQANASYGGVAHWERASRATNAFRYQT